MMQNAKNDQQPVLPTINHSMALTLKKKLNLIIFKVRFEDQLLPLLVKRSDVCSTHISSSFNFNFARLPLTDFENYASCLFPPQFCSAPRYKLIDNS